MAELAVLESNIRFQLCAQDFQILRVEVPLYYVNREGNTQARQGVRDANRGAGRIYTTATLSKASDVGHLHCFVSER
jgi:Ni,Fe-hydrogenase III large subunit